MKIESLTARDVKQLIDSQDFLAGSIIPIVRHRAESQFLNPDLHEDDVILNIARDDHGRIMGFIGALPGSLGDHGRFAWNSGWWVDPETGREAAMPLFYKFMEQWEMRVMFSDLTPQTFEILSRINFIRTSEREGIRLYYRSVLSGILVQRSLRHKNFRWLFTVVDLFVNLFMLVCRAVWKLAGQSQGIPEKDIKEMDEIDNETEELISRCRGPKNIPRGKWQLDWIIAHPWILREKPDQQKDKYPFSSFDEDFEQLMIRIESRAESGTAFLIINIHNRHLKIPYLYYKGETVLHDVASFLNRLAVSRRVSMLSSYHPGLTSALWDVRGPVLYRKPIIRYTGCSEDLYKISGDGFVLQDGDGDAVFT